MRRLTMRGAVIVAILTAAGGAYNKCSLSSAFVQPGYHTSHWASSRVRKTHDSGTTSSPHTIGRTDREYGFAQKAQTLALDVAGSMIAHPAKAARGGEDAFFVLEHDLGVFDGVGAWAAKGHDPGIFTRGFAEAVAANVSAQRVEETSSLPLAQEGGLPKEGGVRVKRRISDGVDLQQALEHGTREAPGKGTCTACVVTFDPNYGMLNGANVGDSGALLIRRDARGTPFVALRSAAQRHRFNQPYQLGTDSRDRPADAQSFLFYLREDDVVILATDGLLDNMYEADIIRCISETRHSGRPSLPDLPGEVPMSAAELAGTLARKAFDLSRDKKRISPWEDEAVAAGIVPARETGIPAVARQPGWSWDASQWGSALERSLFSARGGVRNPSGKGTEGMDSRKTRSAEMSEEDMRVFRGGKTDDITVVVATVRRARKKRRRKIERSGDGSSSDFAATDEAGARAGVDTR